VSEGLGKRGGWGKQSGATSLFDEESDVGEQRWCLCARELGGAARGKKGEDVLVLLSGGSRNAHQAFSEQVAALALRAEAALPPQHEGPQFALGVVVCRLDVRLVVLVFLY
jgi:hypothetical protein